MSEKPVRFYDQEEWDTTTDEESSDDDSIFAAFGVQPPRLLYIPPTDAWRTAKAAELGLPDISQFNFGNQKEIPFHLPPGDHRTQAVTSDGNGLFRALSFFIMGEDHDGAQARL